MRSSAQAFTPHPHYYVEGERLCISMSTPLGTRTEWLHPYGPAESDTDPQGHQFLKTVAWEGHRLVSTFRCKEIADVVTTRWIEADADGSEMLYQETAWEGVRFTRHFRRLDEVGESGLV